MDDRITSFTITCNKCGDEAVFKQLDSIDQKGMEFDYGPTSDQISHDVITIVCKNGHYVELDCGRNLVL